MFRIAVIFFVVIAVGAALWLMARSLVRAKHQAGGDLEEWYLHARYCTGEFSPEEYRNHLHTVRSRSLPKVQ
jgi:uncharacterized membrane protein